MGECADDIVTTLCVNEETTSYTDVSTVLNGYFAARCKTTVERARFNTQKQTPEESVDALIKDLYRIAEDCKYSTLKDQHIRDTIVVGVLNDTLSDHLQIRPHTRRRRSHESPSRSKKTEPYGRLRR